MIHAQELEELGVPIITKKSTPNSQIEKSVPAGQNLIPLDSYSTKGIIKMADMETVEKALAINDRMMNAREKMDEINSRRQNTAVVHDLKSYLFDPYDVYEYTQHGQLRSKRGIGWWTLRQMADQEIPAAIIETRASQAIRFAKPSEEGLGETGFRVKLRDRRATATDSDRVKFYEIEQFIYRTGWAPGYVGLQKRDSFKVFLRKVLRDRLTYDKVNIELERRNNGQVFSFHAVDPTTIYPVIPKDSKEYNIYMGLNELYRTERFPAYTMDDPQAIAYVQRILGRDVAFFTRQDMLNIAENKRTDIRLFGFGISELELLIRIVTAWINGLAFSTSTFTHNRMPAGVLSVVGNWNTQELKDFKDELYLSMSNNQFRHRVPIMRVKEGKGVEFVEFKKNAATSEEQHKFLTFMAQIAGSIFKIDIEELGFQGLKMGGATLTQANPADKIKYSKDKGFEPLMGYIADIINDNLISEIEDGRFVFEWVGLKDELRQEKIELRKERLEVGATVRELREENDEEMPKDADGNEPAWLDAPANTVLYQAWALEQTNKREDARMAEEKAQEDAQYANEEDTPDNEGEVGPGERRTPGIPAPTVPGGAAPGGAAPGGPPLGKSMEFVVQRINDRHSKT